LRIKSFIVDTNNWLNEIFSSFNSLNRELSLGFCLVDTFSSHFSFHPVNQKDTNTKITHCNKFDIIYEDSLIDQNTVSIISNASVKNNIITLVLHIHRGQDIIAKTVYHLMNIMSTKTELFSIRCGINYVTQMQDIAYIIVITDIIPATKCIFDTSIYLYQLNSITISNDLRDFFNKNSNDSILFCDCLNSNKWPPHLLVDKKSKYFKINSVLLNKSSWEFSRKE